MSSSREKLREQILRTVFSAEQERSLSMAAAVKKELDALQAKKYGTFTVLDFMSESSPLVGETQTEAIRNQNLEDKEAKGAAERKAKGLPEEKKEELKTPAEEKKRELKEPGPVLTVGSQLVPAVMKNVSVDFFEEEFKDEMRQRKFLKYFSSQNFQQALRFQHSVPFFNAVLVEFKKHCTVSDVEKVNPEAAVELDPEVKAFKDKIENKPMYEVFAEYRKIQLQIELDKASKTNPSEKGKLLSDKDKKAAEEERKKKEKVRIESAASGESKEGSPAVIGEVKRGESAAVFVSAAAAAAPGGSPRGPLTPLSPGRAAMLSESDRRGSGAGVLSLSASGGGLLTDKRGSVVGTPKPLPPRLGGASLDSNAWLDKFILEPQPQAFEAYMRAKYRWDSHEAVAAEARHAREPRESDKGLEYPLAYVDPQLALGQELTKQKPKILKILSEQIKEIYKGFDFKASVSLDDRVKRMYNAMPQIQVAGFEAEIKGALKQFIQLFVQEQKEKGRKKDEKKDDITATFSHPVPGLLTVHQLAESLGFPTHEDYLKFRQARENGFIAGFEAAGKGEFKAEAPKDHKDPETYLQAYQAGIGFHRLAGAKQDIIGLDPKKPHDREQLCLLCYEDFDKTAGARAATERRLTQMQTRSNLTDLTGSASRRGSRALPPSQQSSSRALDPILPGVVQEAGSLGSASMPSRPPSRTNTQDLIGPVHPRPGPQAVEQKRGTVVSQRRGTVVSQGPRHVPSMPGSVSDAGSAPRKSVDLSRLGTTASLTQGDLRLPAPKPGHKPGALSAVFEFGGIGQGDSPTSRSSSSDDKEIKRPASADKVEKISSPGSAAASGAGLRTDVQSSESEEPPKPKVGFNRPG